MDWLKDLDFAKVMIWVVPGTFIALFRSFTLRGSFPSIAKDDIAALVLGSVVYNFFLRALTPDFAFGPTAANSIWSFGLLLLVLVFLPIVVGVIFGVFESGDYTGRALRHFGLKFPSPTPTAWETLFKELEKGSVLLITLKNDARIYGRWVGGKRLSSASTDPNIMDIFISEIGTISSGGKYVAKKPQRGIYIAASEIRCIEVV